MKYNGLFSKSKSEIERGRAVYIWSTASVFKATKLVSIPYYVNEELETHITASQCECSFRIP